MVRTYVVKLFKTRFKNKIIIVLLIILIILFVQIGFYNLIEKNNNENNETNNERQKVVNLKSIKGVHPKMLHFYERIPFQCIQSKEIIDLNHVNDDYCDCNDGSDEPGTSACEFGVFHCDTQLVDQPSDFKNSIPTYKINDGICDCCDGSDEFDNHILNSYFKERYQEKLKRYLVPCTNRCPN